MNNKKDLCLVQQKKIGFYSIIIVISFIAIVVINVTIVATNSVIQNRIIEKKSNIGAKRAEATKVQKTVKLIENSVIDSNLKRKNGFYTSFDKQNFITSVISKMNNEDDLDMIDEIRDKKINIEYSSFLIRINSYVNPILEKTITKLKKQLIVSGMQNVDATLDNSTLKIDFNSDYEYVAYRVFAMIKQLLPGYLVVKSFSVQPINDEMKHLLYNRKFNQQKINYKQKLDNRLSCSIELEWIFLKGKQPKK